MRLAPLPGDQWDVAVGHALSKMLSAERRNPQDAGNALSTFAHHPDLARAFLGFNVHLLYRSTLPGRLRELAILRVAHRRGCLYEWTYHVLMGKEEGLTDEEIDAATRGAAADPVDQAVLTAVDELDERSEMSDATWNVLSEHLDTRQRMDLIFTVGCYTLLAMAFNTFGVQLDDANLYQTR